MAARRDADLIRDYRIAPEGAVLLLRAELGRRHHRLLGILKTQDEFVGLVQDERAEFEIWERRAHAVHATGRMRGRRGGTRLEMTFVITRRTRVLVILLAVLYAVASYGVLQQSEGPALPLPRVLITLGGAVAVAAIFALAAERQRSALRGFVDHLFREVERG